MISYNLHTHTRFSDGGTEPLDYVTEALAIGFSDIGFSEHSPLPFDNPFSLKMDHIDEYIGVTNKLKREFTDKINIYRALEMDYIQGMSTNFDYWRSRCRVDYLIGSVHLVKPEDSEGLWFTDGPKY